ncbi:MAG: hypothetical protein NVS1B4_17690 [Gemmatimonadaceae bacterium]
MPLVTRRTFLALVGTVTATAVVSPDIDAATGGWDPPPPQPLDRSSLGALAVAILPGELRVDEALAVADSFQRWLAGFRAGVELVHGYGTPDIPRAGASPAATWASQLEELDRLARRREGRHFRALDAERRRALIRDQLTGPTLPSSWPRDPARAGHVAVALLAFYYAQPEATDRCYGALIARNACRPLSANPMRPVTLPRVPR